MAGSRPRLSVAVRTQGIRPDLLDEALTSLAAQTVDDFEVLLAVQADGDAVDRVRASVRRFAPGFAGRVDVFAVPPGSRAAPLNAALDRASGDLLAFLDDDDVVTATWAEASLGGAEAAPGRMVRSITADQPVRRLRAERPPFFEPTGPVVVPDHRKRFDLVAHLEQNRTPICAYAVPLRALREAGVRFDESLSVMEDWHFLVHAALRLGVHDTGEVTAVYRRWDDHEATWHSIDHDRWRADRRRIWQSFNDVPLMLPPGSADRLRSLLARANRPTEPPPPAPASKPEGARDDRELQRLRRERDRARARVEAIEASTSWRITAPVRRLLDYLRGKR
jgi:glycosyltransferase involved in cell wall biosynthesis